MEIKHFERAIELAHNGVGMVHPNPAVGAVIVKDGEVIGEGWHRRAGTDHAEVAACKSVQKKEDIQGADMYVTLEPCSHFGKTPPCVDTIKAYGIKRVFIGMRDPFPRVNGKGISTLKDAGISIHVLPSDNPMAIRIRRLNQAYLKWVGTGLPFVTLKAGVSLDGRIATYTGQSHWITDEQARTDARLERSICDAVLIGAGTVMADHPTLAAHGRWSQKKLKRIILDGELRCDPNEKVFRDSNAIVCTTGRAPKERQELFASKGIRVEVLDHETISIKKLLQFLGKEYIVHVYVEGGSNVHGSFHDELTSDPLSVDEILFYIAPKLVGGRESLSVIGGKGVDDLATATAFKDYRVRMLGDTIKVRGTINLY